MRITLAALAVCCVAVSVVLGGINVAIAGLVFAVLATIKDWR